MVDVDGTDDNDVIDISGNGGKYINMIMKNKHNNNSEHCHSNYVDNSVNGQSEFSRKKRGMWLDREGGGIPLQPKRCMMSEGDAR